MNDIYLNFLKSNGVFLYTGEYALSKVNALNYIKLLKNKKFILGVDLYVQEDEELHADSASWFMEPDDATIEDSVKKSIEFIKQFNEDTGLFFVFII